MSIVIKEFDDLYLLANDILLVSKLENHIYHTAERLSNNKYKSGSWKSVAFKEKDGFVFVLNGSEEFELAFENYFSATVDSKTFSVIVFIYAVNEFVNAIYEKDEDILVNALIDILDNLKSTEINYILDNKKKVSQVFSAID